jgi:hypothetical protein
VRYQLLSHYIEMQQPEKARLILEQYQEDSAHWIYSDALLAFWQLGDCRQTRFLRRKAAKCNPHVIDFLISARHLPKALPDRFNDGSEEEAIIYTWYNRKLWQAVPEALDWLQSSWH